MQSIGSLLQLPIKPKKQFRSERNELFSQIIDLCSDPREVDLRRKLNLKRYAEFCKDNKLKWKDPKNQDKFMKTRSFLKPMTKALVVGSLCRMKAKDLYYVQSVCKDKLNRGESVSQYIMVCTRLMNKRF